MLAIGSPRGALARVLVDEFACVLAAFEFGNYGKGHAQVRFLPAALAARALWKGVRSALSPRAPGWVVRSHH